MFVIENKLLLSDQRGKWMHYPESPKVTKWLHVTSTQVHQIVDIQHLKIHSLLNSCIGTKNVQFIENDQMQLLKEVTKPFIVKQFYNFGFS